MRASVLIAILLLSACADQSEQADDAAVTDDTAASASGAAMVPGLYEVGDETTVYGRTRLNEDGTYADLSGDETVGGGTWRNDGTAICFDPEGDGDDQQERCWINGPADEDGSFVSSRVDGSQSYRVTPIIDEPSGD